VLWTCSEVQPNEAGALAAVVQALTKGDAASRQERFRWIVTEGERAAVQPGEVGRLRRGPCDLGKLGRQLPARELAVCGELSADSVEQRSPWQKAASAAVDLGLREAAAGGTTLDAGQTSMVRTLATDRRQLQLVIAPASAGKTTALRVLAYTWTGGGGHILGLAPSATAAAQLAEATGIPADTLHDRRYSCGGRRPVHRRGPLGAGSCGWVI
jgi:AAA domain